MESLEGRRTAAIEHLGEAYEEAAAEKLARLHGRALYLMGCVEQRQSGPREALVRFEEAADIFHHEELPREQATAMIAVAVACFERGAVPGDEMIHLGELGAGALGSLPADLWSRRTI